jgi:hypothetical protein
VIRIPALRRIVSEKYGNTILVVLSYVAYRLLSKGEHPLLAGLCFLAFLLQLPYLLLRTVISVKGDLLTAKPYLIALVFGVALYSWTFMSNRTHFDAVVKLLLFPAHYQRCIDSGIHFENDKVLTICTLENEDTFALLATEPVFEDGIIYDSSDEIVLPPPQRSSQWKIAASKLPPFGLMGYDATLLIKHFYFVRFSSNMQSSL